MTHHTRSGSSVSPAPRTLAPPAAPSGDICDRGARLLSLVAHLVQLAADGGSSPLRRLEAHRLAAQTVKQARAVLTTWAEEPSDEGGWAAAAQLELNDALAVVEASVLQLGALPLPSPAYTSALAPRPAPRARRAGGAS